VTKQLLMQSSAFEVGPLDPVELGGGLASVGLEHDPPALEDVMGKTLKVGPYTPPEYRR